MANSANDVELRGVYNLGYTGAAYSLSELASYVKDEAMSRMIACDVLFEDSKQFYRSSALSAELFCTSFSWNPEIDIRHSISDIFRENIR